MKLFWSGTDSLMLIDVSKRKLSKKLIWILFRYVIRFLDRFYVEEHYCDAENIADNVRRFGVCKPVSVMCDRLGHTEQCPKISHNGFNVIYYMPKHHTEKKFKEWLYGYDILLEIKSRMPHINFIELDGSMEMSEVYGIADFYLRPNRHDGASRMRQECEIQGIPYYWSNKNPNIEEAIKTIQDEYERKPGLQQESNKTDY